MRKTSLFFLASVLLLGFFYLRINSPLSVQRLGMERNAVRPVIAKTPAFELIRENGESFGSKQLLGKVWVGSFIFTTCPNQCPALSAKLKMLQKNLPQNARTVSFSVDPTHDTPGVLKSYAAKFGADPDRWIHLTGNPGTIGQIQQDWHLSKNADPNLHSLRFVLVDKSGNVRGYYDSDEADEITRLTKDIQILDKE